MNRLLLILTLLLGGCGPIANMMDDDERKEYEAMLLEEVRLKEALATAPVEDKPAIEGELEELQVKIAKVENVAQRRALGPIWGALRGIPLVGPYLEWAGPFAATLALPFLSKRGRKHYKSLVKNLTPGVVGADGSKGINPMDALLDLGRAFGVAHSNEASKAAAGG